MFGQNEISGYRAANQGFLVHSIFYTIQGEGPWAGRPAIFLRLAGCNLRCFWCDTDFDVKKGQHYTADTLAFALTYQAQKNKCNRIVITGGEPLLQPLPLLFEQELAKRLEFQIETSGTAWPEGMSSFMHDAEAPKVMLVVSPKTPRIVSQIEGHAYAYKYIIRAGEQDSNDGLPVFSTQKKGQHQPTLFRPASTSPAFIYVQPCDEQDPELNKKNMQAAVYVAKKYNYRLSVQVHKIAEVE